jgi:hypothetical protein
LFLIILFKKFANTLPSDKSLNVLAIDVKESDIISIFVLTRPVDVPFNL